MYKFMTSFCEIIPLLLECLMPHKTLDQSCMISMNDISCMCVCLTGSSCHEISTMRIMTMYNDVKYETSCMLYITSTGYYPNMLRANVYIMI